MVIVKINRKLLGFAVIYIASAFLGFGAFRYVWQTAFPEKDESMISFEAQKSGSALAVFLVSGGDQAQKKQDVEIFDIGKGSVIKKVSSGPAVRKEAAQYLQGITGMYVKVKAFPDRGYIIRIPLNPPVTVQNEWLTGAVPEIFVLFPGGEAPYLLVLDEKSRPLFFTFAGETDTLLKLLNFQQEKETGGADEGF